MFRSLFFCANRLSTKSVRLLVLPVALLPVVVAAFQNDASPTGLAPGEQEVVIKREALKLIDPRTYRASMQLQAARSLDLTAPTDGIVRSVAARPQQKINPQAEIVRLNDATAALQLKGAKARLQVAQIEKKIAQGKADADQTALAEARLEAALADVELADLGVERLIVRAPFAGDIERVYVTEGQFVRAGDKLATLVDSTKLSVEVPVERAAAAPGKPVDIRVEETMVKATVESVMPLAPRFDAIRELAVSPASALVNIDNANGRHFVGQTVYSDLIPLTPVALVPSAAISNQPDGNRKVQVLRDNVVRDMTVKILAKVGTDGVYVAGRFSEGDEVIASATRALSDGTPLRSLAASAAPPKTEPGSSGTAPGARRTVQPGGF